MSQWEYLQLVQWGTAAWDLIPDYDEYSKLLQGLNKIDQPDGWYEIRRRIGVALNTLGQDGWELISTDLALADDLPRGLVRVIVLYFKRST